MTKDSNATTTINTASVSDVCSNQKPQGRIIAITRSRPNDWKYECKPIFAPSWRLLKEYKDELEQKKLLTSLTFESFMRELLRRLGDLSEAYCGGSRIDFQLFSQQAAAVGTDKSVLCFKDWERYSQSQKFRMKLGGLVGTLSLEGDIEPFIPYLRLGEWLHVGKNTTFGLGQYQLIL